MLKQNPLYLSPKNTFGNYFLPDATTGADLNQVKMREAVSSRRCRRSSARGQRIEEINSSSGNWSASSESGRTSASSENTVQTKTLLSDGSSHFKRKLLDSSTPSRNGSSELSRNGELSHRDMYDDENSSIYSCDTEGYFTSFHLDSGLKSMRHTNGMECEYGLFGKSPIPGSRTHTNGDMSGDDVDEDDSSLHHTLVHVDLDFELAQFRRQLKNDCHGNDSDFEFPNSNELHLIDQESRLRAEKTLIDSSRIPSMSEITPSNSDEDEQIVLESLLQTLNCKPLEVLASGTERKPGRVNAAASVKSPQSLSPIGANRSPVTLKTSTQLNTATIAKQPIRSKANSRSLYDVSDIPADNNANHKASKYWTMPLLKKKRFLRMMKSIDQPDGVVVPHQMPSDKVPFNKCDKSIANGVPVIVARSVTASTVASKPVPPIKTSTLSTNTTNTFVAVNRSEIVQCNVRSSADPPKVVPKTTLMDFKKLLLSTAGKKNYDRPSATELLKVAKEPPFPIQNLSYSPRALSNRRPMRGQKHTSPVKKSNVMSPRSKWKYKHFDTNYITSIPEATNEEENASISSQDANLNDNECGVSALAIEPLSLDEPLAATIETPTATPIKATPIKAVPIEAAPIEAAPIVCHTEKENDLNNAGISLKNNLFLQEEENNFMRGEVKKYTPVRKLVNFEKRIDPFSEFRKENNTIDEPDATIENNNKVEQRPTLETSF